ncbi:TIGR04255 family protein [Thermosipho africanus]|uniref:TIGR04255 family protein n=1 Tax=Thermosipho africanus TaxID=2421 RepID=UPI0002DC0406|nr:TIGR04255 family protein [Thermosipho africanus]
MTVQLGPGLLAVNVFKPYPTWSVFRQKIEKAWNSLCSLIKIDRIQRIGLRYINNIDIPDSRDELGNYFRLYPFIPSEFRQNIISFNTTVIFSYFEGRDQCRVQFLRSPNSTDSKTKIILDIDYFLAKEPVDPSEVFTWIEEAHDNIESIFEASITEHLRKMF